MTATSLALIASALLAFAVPAAVAEPATQPTTAPSASTTSVVSPPLRLWDGPAPFAVGDAPTDVPTLTLYRPAGPANGAMVVICPGGGYQHLADHEGDPVARFFNSFGVTAAVLKYRLAPKYDYRAITADVARALRVTRSHAADWQIDPARVGILGFSAGGHLASTAATQFDAGDPAAADPIERLGDRPDFAVLVYPVVTMTSFTHGGSRKNLIGADPSPELIARFSGEGRVTAQTPPTFLVHTADDKTVPVQNSLAFAAALGQAHVPFELHVFAHGPHGFGLGEKYPALGVWPGLCERWMEGRNLLKPATK